MGYWPSRVEQTLYHPDGLGAKHAAPKSLAYFDLHLTDLYYKLLIWECEADS